MSGRIAAPSGVLGMKPPFGSCPVWSVGSLRILATSHGLRLS